MKKILLGTTGLIGAALLSAAANAETPKVTLGGFADFQAGYTSDDNDEDRRGSAFRNDNEVHVRVDGKTAGGLGYGAVIELEADTTNDVDGGTTNATRTFTYLEGNWGRFEMGDVEGAAQAMRVDASSIAVATGGIDGSWVYFVNTAAEDAGANDLGSAGTGFVTTPALPTEHGSNLSLNDETTYNATKINYYSPKFSGFQVGASYAPDLGTAGQTINNVEDIDAGLNAITDYGDVLNLGIAFDHQFDNAWTLGAAFTGEWAEADSSTNAARSNDINAWNIGAKLGYQAFAVAASYGDWDDSRDSVAAPSLESDYWTLGASYETGPFGLSATYLKSDVEQTATTENEFTNLVIGADYKLAPGLTPYAEVSFYEFDEAGTGVATFDNDGTVFLLGTQVAF